METKDSIKGLMIKRVFDAPVDLVFRAFTVPEMMMKWWGPKDFTSPKCEIDLRVGGKYFFSMHSPDGKDYYSTGIVQELIVNQKIVYTDSFADEKGNVISGSEYGLGDDWPESLLVTLTFETVGDKTQLTLIHEGLPEGEIREMTSAGWNESLDKLEAALRNQG